jgi:hypothetical protein
MADDAAVEAAEREGPSQGNAPAKRYEVPAELPWFKFLERMGWTDREVLGRQPVLHVQRSLLIHTLEQEFGHWPPRSAGGIF